MALKWHREKDEQGLTRHYATYRGERVAEASLTGRPGVDNYPWDWWLTVPAAANPGRDSGVEDTLRACKERVRLLFKEA